MRSPLSLALVLCCLSASLVYGVAGGPNGDDAADAAASSIDAVAETTTTTTPTASFSSAYPSWNSTSSVLNETWTAPVEPVRSSFEKFISVVGPGTFFLLALMTGIGNTLIILVILLNRSMHNFQNILVINFALAEILFVGVCMPFITVDYAGTSWPFSEDACKGVTYAANVTSLASIYLLLLLAGDR